MSKNYFHLIKALYNDTMGNYILGTVAEKKTKEVITSKRFTKTLAFVQICEYLGKPTFGKSSQ